MNAKEHTIQGSQTLSAGCRISIVLVLASPFLFLCGGFILFPSAAVQHLGPLLQPLTSVFIGIVSATVWQFSVLFGWFVLLCLYLYCVDLSFQRRSLAIALSTVLVAVSFAGLLLYQQQRIAIATADAYFD